MPVRAAPALRILGAGTAVLVLLGLLAVLLLTRTDWGRERVRAFGVRQLASQVAGRVTIEKLRGNLLTGATLENVSITDSAGAPFLRADTIQMSYSVRSFLSKHLIFRDILLVRPTIVLDQAPGEKWNFERLFPKDTAVAVDTVPGLGSWVRLEDVTIQDGTIIMRGAWSPDDSLRGEARERAIEVALSSDNRRWVVPVPGGYQVLSLFHQLYAELPLVRLADPDSAARVVDVASLRAIAFPFRPPAVTVTALAGRFVVTEDTLEFRDLRGSLPVTRFTSEGRVALSGEGLRVAMRASPLVFEDMRWLLPSLPEGGGHFNGSIAQSAGGMHVVADDIELESEGGRIAGKADVQFGDTLRLGSTDLVFTGIDTRMVERYARDGVRVNGVASGHLALAGSPSQLRLDGWAEFRERSGAVSRVVAEGEIGTGDGAFRARELRLRFEPVRMTLARSVRPDLPLTGLMTGVATLTGSTSSRFDLTADLVHRAPSSGRSHVIANGGLIVGDGIAASDLRVRLDPVQVAALRPFAPDLPIGGTLTGRATLNGSPTSRVSATVDVVHHDETGSSRMIGGGSYLAATTPRFEVDVRMPSLSLETVGRFAPAAGLHGNAAGSLSARGTTADLAFHLGLDVSGGGEVDARGSITRRRGVLGYDVQALMDQFNAAASSTRAPATALTGTAAVRGVGTDPATLSAAIAADFVDLRWDTARVDTSQIRATLAQGLARVERGHIRIGNASADVEGSFGLVSGRTGELRYRVAVDSLGYFAPYFPSDTTFVPARPVLQARRLARARADSARLASETEVRRLATGYPRPPTLEVDTIVGLRRDTVAGRLYAEGTLSGNLDRFDVSGTAEADHVIAAGTQFGHGRATFLLSGFGAPDATLRFDAGVDSLRTAGFAFDSASVHAEYTGMRGSGHGSAELAVFQDPERDYRLRSEFLLELDRREITFHELILRFDTAQWTAPRPGAIRWAGAGVSVDSIELRGNAGGRIFVDGRLPTEGPADLHVLVDRLPIGQMAALLQDTLTATGLFQLDTRLRGTLEAPRFEGTTSLLSANYGGRPELDLRATFEYADNELAARAQLSEQDTHLLDADAQVPVNLAVRGVQGSRLLDRPLRIDARADSLPLEALPSFTDMVQDVRGLVRGDLAVRGTVETPELSGDVTLDRAALHVVEPGLALREVSGLASFRGNVLRVDSLVGWSGGGPIRVTGELNLETLTSPSFDLAVTARNALVLNNKRGRLRADADLTIEGPLDATRIAGDVQIEQGVAYVPDAPKKRITNLDDPRLGVIVDTAALPPELIPRPSQVLENLQLDIGVSVARNTWVRSSDGNVEVYTPNDGEPVRITSAQGLADLRLDGVINADRGEYRFSGRVFELTTGSVTFLPGETIDPLLQLSANYEVPRRGREALIIQIHLTGPMSAPRVTLESTAQPPLSQSEIITFLAFGRSASTVLDVGDSGLSGSEGNSGIGALAQQQLSALAVGAVTEDVIASLERRGSRAGLDVFRINPAELPEEAAFSGYFENFLRGTEVVAGKYMGSRLFFAARGRTTTEAFPGLSVEYQTPRGFSWVTTWEPRFLPSEPSLVADQTAASTRAFGSFFFWSRRF